ncbi:MAG: flagellar protein [Lachnospiraceae bacterium]|jgi:flagellar operon protein|nr:flagellar protein [Lachnospiraceae bacterium]
MKLQNNQFLSIEQLQDQYLTKNVKNAPTHPAEALSFKAILDQQAAGTTEVKFSKHAIGRLADRNITLSEDQRARLNEGTVKAEAKGIKESLVIVDQMAFIVNIPNNTVVTAMNQGEAREQIFTNIDGAVIM